MQKGFDHSYSLNDLDRYFAPRQHTEDDVPLPGVAPGNGYYASRAIANHAIKCLGEHAEKFSEQPLFEYLAFTAPHFPLQTPAEDIARCLHQSVQGWDAMREKRRQRMGKMGIGGKVPSLIERDLGRPYASPEAIKALGFNEVNRPLPGSELSQSQREFPANKMAVRMAMVDPMDPEIGRMIGPVCAMGAIENTLILFLSDNGASPEMMVRGDGHDPEAVWGTGATFLSLGPGWSSLANTPFRRHKTGAHEGDIFTPLILQWPRGIAARGQLRYTPGHLIDLVPAILEVAGGKRFERWDGKPGPTAPGKSLVPLFVKDGTVKHDSF